MPQRKTDTKVLQMRGSHRGRKRAKEEPKFEPGSPDKPDWLSDYASEEWDRVEEILDEAGLLTRADGAVLAMYCQAMSDYRETREIVEEEGWTEVTEKGNTIQHPVVGAMNKAWDRVMKSAAKLGLSPADRAGLKVAKAPPAKDGKAKFFGKTTKKGTA